MEVLDKYQAAKKDISLNKHPHRQDGHIHWTPGHRTILSKKNYSDLRVFNQEIDQLQRAREEKVRQMLLFQTPFDDREAHHQNQLGKIKKQFQDIEEKYSMKETERNNILDDLKNRGIQLEQPDIENTRMPAPERKKRSYRIFTIILIYLVIEVFIYITQYESQRDIKSYEEIGARVLAMFILVGAFHIVAHLNRLEGKLIYTLYLGFNILLITAMMFAPPVLHFAYPETASTASTSIWSLTDQSSEPASIVNESDPAWIGLYRKMEWAPAGIGIIVFLIIFFVVPNPLFSKQDRSKAETLSNTKTKEGMDENSWFQKELRTLKHVCTSLKTERDQLLLKFQKIRNDSTDILPIRNELQKIKKSIREIDDKVVTLKIKKEELFHDLETELNEYRVEFENLLTNDPIKSTIMTPEWPTRNDILLHFKVASL